jgi:hypothetical protein
MDNASDVACLYRHGLYSSAAQASRSTGVPATTVRERLHGKQPRSQTTHPMARLARYEEEVLVKYI